MRRYLAVLTIVILNVLYIDCTLTENEIKKCSSGRD